MERLKSNYHKIHNSQVKDLLFNLLLNNNYLSTNKTLIKKIGLLEASIYSNYLEKYRYFEESNKYFDGWFFLTHESICEELNIAKKTLIRIKKILKNLNLITIKKKGMPAKEWIFIDFETLYKIIFPDPPLRGGQDPPLRGGLYNKPKSNKPKKEKTNKKEFFLLLFPNNFQTNKNFQEVINQFIIHRQKINKPLSELAMKKIANKINNINPNIDSIIQSFQESIDKKWIGVFPEKIKIKQIPQIPNNSKMFVKKFNRLVESFQEILPTTQKTDIYSKLCEFYPEIDTNLFHTEDTIPTTFNLILDYIDWIHKNNWINDKDLHLLSIKNKLFEKFKQIYSSNIGINIFTGKIV